MLKPSILALSIGLLAASPLAAQHAAGGHSGDMTHNMAGSVPTEPGQGAFAAIAEIVAMLAADPATDWNSVDIPALRVHLIDMSNVTLGAVVTTQDISGGARFSATGTPEVVASLQRMVPAHAAVMDGVNGWQLTATTSANGAVLEVTGSAQDEAMIRGLGFIGVMAMGMHHQPHHLAIASGNSPH